MNRQKLTELITYPERLSSRETAMLTEMAAQYPYATVVQILLAKSMQQHADARQSLANAALYTPNRQILRLVMEDKLPRLGTETAPVSKSHSEENGTNEETPESPTGSSFILTASGTAQKQTPFVKKDVFEELQKNLKQLRDKRSQKYLQNNPDADPHGPVSTSSSLVGMHPTLKQIVEEHAQLNLNNPHIQQQRNLIDSFLQNVGDLPRRQPQASNPAEEVDDLSQRNTLSPQDLATETLALIMERQGKNEKAIDIYEKLILKYPQKSAYFADCIERLKKES